MVSFNEHVWELLTKIPKGSVTTYKILAQQLGTTAYRAVGAAVGKNPRIPEVPCHRVVGSNGALTGYAHGLEKKKQLLKEEGIMTHNGKIVDFDKKLFSF